MSELWDSVAPGWEANAGFVDEQLAAATEPLLDAAQIGEGDRLLDLAAGPGSAGLAATQRVGTTGRVVLSDVAAEMAAVAAKRASADAQVSTEVFDQSAIDFGEASFDAVINRHGLMFVEDPAKTVAEAVRVLRAGGHYAAMTWDRRELNPWLGLVLDPVGAQFGVPFPPPNVRPGLARHPRQGHVRSAGWRSPERSGPGYVHAKARSVARGVMGAGARACGSARDRTYRLEADVRDAIRERATQSGATAAGSNEDGIMFESSVLIGSGHKAAR